MKGIREQPLRVMVRLVWLGCTIVWVVLDFLICVLLRRGGSLRAVRAAWQQDSARRLGRVLGLECCVSGPVPARGLLVSNHLSYLDILVLGSLTPAAFVAKNEVKSWPVFGWLATLAGTVFIHRERRTHVGAVSARMESILQQNVLVVLFPEGTSSDGSGVLPFKSALLEPAARQSHPLCAGLIQYELADGDVAEEVCYWKDMSFGPHLLNLLSKRSIRATVRFAPWTGGAADRKELAVGLHAQIMQLRHSAPKPG
jgi:1-acyl-sn-glycerol-3-phosphate acyltransferase